jgi:hypothetical protein
MILIDGGGGGAPDPEYQAQIVANQVAVAEAQAAGYEASVGSSTKGYDIASSELPRPTLLDVMGNGGLLPIALPVTGFKPGEVTSIAMSGNLGLFGAEFDLLGNGLAASLDMVTGTDGKVYFCLSGGYGVYVGTGGGFTISVDSGLTNGPNPGQYPGLSQAMGIDHVSPVGVGLGTSVSGTGEYTTVKAGSRFGTPGTTAYWMLFNWTSQPLFNSR